MAYTEQVEHRAVRRRTEEVVDEPVEGDVVASNENINYASRIIWFVTGVLMLLLGFRFILSLLGANTTNGFAQFIYNTSHPFVAPFFSLFSYNNIQYGVSRFEIYTLVAMLVYFALAWILNSLVNIGRR